MNIYSMSPMGPSNDLRIFQKSLTLLVFWKIEIQVPGEFIDELNMFIGSRVNPKFENILFKMFKNTQYTNRK